MLECKKDFIRAFGKQSDLDVRYLNYNPIDSYRRLDEIDFVFSFYYHRKLSRRCLWRAKELGISTFLIQDGMYDVANNQLNPFVKKNKIILYDFPIADYLIAVGRNISSLYKFEYRKTFNYLPLHMSGVGNIKCEGGVKKKVLITTANSPYFNESEFERLKMLIIQAIDACRSLGVSFGVRIFDERLVSALPQEIELDNDGTFEECILNYGVLFTTPSSISVQAANVQVAIITFQYRNLPFESITTWVAYDLDSVESSLLEAVNSSKLDLKYQNRMLLLNYPEKVDQMFLKNILNECNGKGIELLKKEDYKKSFFDYVEPSLRRFFLQDQYGLLKRIKKWIKK